MLELTPERFEAAVRQAVASGARIPLDPAARLDGPHRAAQTLPRVAFGSCRRVGARRAAAARYRPAPLSKIRPGLTRDGKPPRRHPNARSAQFEDGPEVATGPALDALLERLRPAFFDPAFEPLVTNKSPGTESDVLAVEREQPVPGVAMRDLEGFDERYGLNSRLVRNADGALVEEVYRAGGRYGAAIERIVSHLEAALPLRDRRRCRTRFAR